MPFIKKPQFFISIPLLICFWAISKLVKIHAYLLPAPTAVVGISLAFFLPHHTHCFCRFSLRLPSRACLVRKTEKSWDQAEYVHSLGVPDSWVKYVQYWFIRNNGKFSLHNSSCLKNLTNLGLSNCRFILDIFVAKWKIMTSFPHRLSQYVFFKLNAWFLFLIMGFQITPLWKWKYVVAFRTLQHAIYAA